MDPYTYTPIMFIIILLLLLWVFFLGPIFFYRVLMWLFKEDKRTYKIEKFEKTGY